MSEATSTQEVFMDKTATQQEARDLTASWLSSKIEALPRSEKGERKAPITSAERFLGKIDALEKGEDVDFPEEDGVRCELSEKSHYKNYEYTPSGSTLISAKKNGEGKYECSVKIGDKIETRVMSTDDLKRIYLSASRETVLQMAEKDDLRDVVALGLNAKEDTDLTTEKIEDIALEKKFVPKQIVIDLIDGFNLEDNLKSDVKNFIQTAHIRPEELAKIFSKVNFFSESLKMLDTKISEKALLPKAHNTEEELESLRIQKNILAQFIKDYNGENAQTLLTNLFSNMSGQKFTGFVQVVKGKDTGAISRYLFETKAKISQEQTDRYKNLLKGLSGGGIVSALILIYIYSNISKE